MGLAPISRHLAHRVAARGFEPTIKCTCDVASTAASNGAEEISPCEKPLIVSCGWQILPQMTVPRTHDSLDNFFNSRKAEKGENPQEVENNKKNQTVVVSYPISCSCLLDTPVGSRVR